MDIILRIFEDPGTRYFLSERGFLFIAFNMSYDYETWKVVKFIIFG